MNKSFNRRIGSFNQISSIIVLVLTYLILFSPYGAILQVRAETENKAAQLPNIARNKKATQSSTVYGANASRAVDGNTNGNWAQNSVTHTNAEYRPWLQIDLGAAYDISEIKIYNRTDCCQERLDKFWVVYSDSEIINNANTVKGSGVKSFASTGPMDASTQNPRILRQNAKNVRYIRIYLTGTNSLHLAEVQVFGIASAQPTNVALGTQLTNAALGKSATQSSTAFGGAASRAVDGITDGSWSKNSVTHTNPDREAWWQVDLGGLYDISEIKIYNRTDCCQERLNQFKVIYSDRAIQSNVSANVYEGPLPASSQNPRVLRKNAQNVRFIRIFLTGTNYLHLAEVEVFGTNARNSTPPTPIATTANRVATPNAASTKVTEVTYVVANTGGKMELLRQVGLKEWEHRKGRRPNDKITAKCVEISRDPFAISLACASYAYQIIVSLKSGTIRSKGVGSSSQEWFGLIRATDTFPIISDKDLRSINKFSPAEMKEIMLWIAKETSNSRIDNCYKQNYQRGVGVPLSRCSSGLTEQNGLCYQSCKAGYTGAANFCWGTCPSGFKDIGAFCQKTKSYERPGFGWQAGDPLLPDYSGPIGRCEAKNGKGKCEQKAAVIYPKCRSGYSQTAVNICAPTCPAGWGDTVTGCAKPSYSRGVGKSMVCAPGLERGTKDGVGLLCYSQCKPSYKGNGPICWQDCNTNTTGNQRFDCGVSCSRDVNSCALATSDKVLAPINLIIALLDFGISAKAAKLAKAAGKAAGGAAAAAGGYTALALKDTPKWAKLFNLIKEADNWAKLQGIADATAAAMDIANVAEGLQGEIEHWTDEFEQDFAQNTTSGVEYEIRKRFDHNTQRIIKRAYANYHLSALLESDKFRISKLALSIGAPIAGAIGDPGVLSVINAYAEPTCPPPGGNPFPTVRWQQTAK